MKLQLIENKSVLINGTSKNYVIHGENLAVMRHIHEFINNCNSNIDLMLWDPPYNTGRKDMLYGDDKEDWLSFMAKRLDLARTMLKDSGILAIHIGYDELFSLGILIDTIFGKKNRLGIINWECAYSPKNDSKGIPSMSDYVLIYAKSKEKHFSGIIPKN